MPGLKPSIFLDVKSLKDGEDWQESFLRGILHSMMVVPILSWIGEDKVSLRLKRLILCTGAVCLL